VISSDRLIRDSGDSGDVECYAMFDNALVGVQQATNQLLVLGVLDATGQPTGATGPFAIELIARSPDDNNATVSFTGAMGILEPLLDDGTLVVRSGETDFATIATPGWKGETAATRLAAVQAVRDGRVYSTIYTDTRQLAELAVTLVDAILQGEGPETNDLTSYDDGVMVVPSYLLKSPVVTAGNHEQILIDSGYYTPEDLA